LPESVGFVRGFLFYVLQILTRKLENILVHFRPSFLEIRGDLCKHLVCAQVNLQAGVECDRPLFIHNLDANEGFSGVEDALSDAV